MFVLNHYVIGNYTKIKKKSFLQKKIFKKIKVNLVGSKIKLITFSSLTKRLLIMVNMINYERSMRACQVILGIGSKGNRVQGNERESLEIQL